MARRRRIYKNQNLSKYVAIASLFLLGSAFLIQLPQIFFIIGELGIIVAFIIFGIERYHYYRNAVRFIIWALIPVFAALFTYFHAHEILVFYTELSKFWLLGLFACAFISLYYNRWNVSYAAKIFLFIVVIVLTTIFLVGTVYPDAQFNWGGITPTEKWESTDGYGFFQFPSVTPTPESITKITIPTGKTLPTTPRPTVTYTTPPKVSVSTSEIEQAIYRLTNAERAKAGLASLEWNEQLAIIAREHSQEMAKNNYLSHTNLRGEGPNERATRHGYPIRKPLGDGSYMVGIGENCGKMPTGNVLGMGYVSPDAESIAQAQVQSWMESPGHRSNILNTGYDVIGVGVAYDGSLYYLSTQDFQ